VDRPRAEAARTRRRLVGSVGPPAALHGERTGRERELRLGARRIGDFDQDGAPDFAVGAPYQATAFSGFGGAAYLVSGRSGALLWEFDGPDGVENYGRGLSNVARGFDGRIDSDRIPDLVIGAPKEAGSYSQWHGRVDVRRLSDLTSRRRRRAGARRDGHARDEARPRRRSVGLFAVAFDTTPIGRSSAAPSTPPGSSSSRGPRRPAFRATR
jgi:hypothetical protein